MGMRSPKEGFEGRCVIHETSLDTIHQLNILIMSHLRRVKLMVPTPKKLTISDLRGFLPSLLLLTVLLSLHGSCDRTEAPAGGSGSRWDIYWSYTAGNDPTSGLGIGTGGWASIFNVQANYSTTTALVSTSVVPSDASLNMANPTTLFLTVKDFLDRFQASWRNQINNPDLASYLFGTNAMQNAAPLDYGVTTWKQPDYAAASFVFTQKILNLTGPSAQQKWAMIDYTVLHELGHSRGLNASTTDHLDYDHDHHEGSDASGCIMRINAGYDPPQPFVFCGYHKKVLKDCLNKIRTIYTPGESCAKF